MTKARITYRFDSERRQASGEPNGWRQLGEESPSNNGKVVRLYDSEYRVHGEAEETPAQSAARIHDTEALNPFSTDYGAWQSPFEAETERVERLIRESGTRGRTEPVYRERAERPERTEPVPRERAERPDRTERREYREQRERPEEPYGVEEEDFAPDTGYYRAEDDPYLRRERYDGPYIESTRYVTRAETPWFKIFASAVGAIATGAVFGFLVLSMFGGEGGPVKVAGDWLKLPGAAQSQEAAGDAPPAGEGGLAGGSGGIPQATAPGAAGTPAAGAAAGGGLAAAGEQPAVPVQGGAAVAVARVDLPAATYSFLQGGVFSGKQGADAAIVDMKQKGLAGAAETADKVYVYAGLALTRDDALALSSKLQAKNQEVYIKPYTIPGATGVKWNGPAGASPQDYFVQGASLVQMLGGLTTIHLQESGHAAPEDSTLQSIKAAHQAWSQAAIKAGEGFEPQAKAVVDRMNAAMNTAVLSIDEYKKNPSEAYLWQAQGALMNYLVAEKELLAAVAVQ